MGQDHAEGIERRLGREDVAGELDFTFFRIEGDQQHVVDREQRPDQQYQAEHHRARFGEKPTPPAAPASQPAGCHGDAHNCASLVCSLRIMMMMIGISTGTADITAATPRSGLIPSKV